MEQIGEFYVSDIELAKALTSDILSAINTTENIGIWFNEDLLASKNTTSFQEAEEVEVARQTISGIQKGGATGFVSKAWIERISLKDTSVVVRGDLICGRWKVYSWGDYCGPGETKITYKIEIPENAVIDDAFWLAEPTWQGQPTKLYVNGIELFSGDIQYFVVLNITPYLNPGNNTAVFDSNTGGDDGASHIIVKYSTSQLQTFSKQEKFPFYAVQSKALLHHEKALFIPQNINLIEVILNTTSQTNLSFRKGALKVNIGVKSPSDGIINFTDSDIKSALNARGISYSDLDNEYFFFVAEVGIGESGNVQIGDNSYVLIDSDEPDVPFGSIDITKEIDISEASDKLQNTFYKHLVWKFLLPKNSVTLDADWQLGWLDTGSGGATQQTATANGITLFNSPPDPFIQAFSRFGYSPSLQDGLFVYGENNFTLDFGNSYGVSNESSYGSLTYFLRSFVNFGNSFEKAVGGKRTVVFQDDSTIEITVGNENDAWDPNKDAIDDAVERLLQQFDSEGDGKIDLFLTESAFTIDTLDVSGVPNLWSTEVQIRIWRN